LAQSGSLATHYPEQTGEWAEYSLNNVSDLTKAMARSYTLEEPLSIFFFEIYLRALSAQNNVLPLAGVNVKVK
ncbi:hypothetical protein, partial [Fructobacillus tropaeoli]